MKTGENKTLSETIAEGLKNAIAEAEELRVQLALGKLEARDFFEDLKKNVSTEFRQMQESLKSLKSDPQALKLINAFEQLQVQLALGKAESLEIFEAQKQKISESLHELDHILSHDSELKEEFSQAKLLIEKFKLKLELIALKYRLKKVSTEFALGDLKKEFMDKFEDLKRRLEIKEKEASARWEHFNSEIGNAFEHLKKAFKN